MSLLKGIFAKKMSIPIVLIVVIAILALANRQPGQPSAPRGSQPATPFASGPTPAGTGNPAQPAAASSVPVSVATRDSGPPRVGLPGQWALAALQARSLWRTTTGAGILVAVVDTGVDTGNRDLARAVVNPRHAPPDKSANSHGTAIAGLIAGRGAGPDPKRRILGLAPAANILDIQVTSDPAAVTADEIVDGIDRAITAGAKVINVSLGVPAADPRFNDAIAAALKNGALVVASAGPNGTLLYPANSDGALAVAGVDSQGKHPLTDLTPYLRNAVYAPGVDLSSTARASGAGGGKGGYLPDISGNDYATAYVSAAAALLLAAHPGATAEQVRSLIVDTATSAQPNARAGVLDPRAALRGLPNGPPGPAAPTAAPPGIVPPPVGVPAPNPKGIAVGPPSPPGVLTPVTIALIIIGGLGMAALITFGAVRRRPAGKRWADLITTTWDGW